MFRALLNTLGSPPGLAPSISDWPEATAEAPRIDLAGRTIGLLAFGSPLDEARVLGRPDRAERHPEGWITLIYARLGLMLEFDARKGLEYAAFFVAPDKHDPKHPYLTHTAPRLATGATLTAQTTEADLRTLFGPLKSADRDADEIILVHEHAGFTLECELTPSGTLKRFNLFPTIV